MDKKIDDFLESGILDRYVMGATSSAENKKIEGFLIQYPELKETYDLLQEQLELNALAEGSKPPSFILDDILEAIDDKPVIAMKPAKGVPPWFGIAASVAALIFATTSFIFYNESKTLKDENNTIASEIFDLHSDIASNNKKLGEIAKALEKLNNPETQKYVLRGNDRAKDLKTVAYINPIDKSSLIDVVSLPKLSDQQYYKMWAQVNDKMVDLGILDINDRKLKSVPYVEDALSLSITIENKDGNQGSKAKEVAQIELEKEN
ncbi:MAG: anti-sigma factor [Flavobacteriaceae bacterium]|nr:anti-sigma factor [Flavobacteriaceae bacterium]